MCVCRCVWRTILNSIIYRTSLFHSESTFHVDNIIQCSWTTSSNHHYACGNKETFLGFSIKFEVSALRNVVIVLVVTCASKYITVLKLPQQSPVLQVLMSHFNSFINALTSLINAQFSHTLIYIIIIYTIYIVLFLWNNPINTNFKMQKRTDNWIDLIEIQPTLWHDTHNTENTQKSYYL